MKKQHSMLAAAFFMGLTLAISCTKTDLLNFKWDRHAEGKGYVAKCKLRSFTYDDQRWDGALVEGIFEYAPTGNPTSLTFGDFTGTGTPNHYFFYDQKNRLREYREAYSPNDPVEAVWHRYGYNNNNQIIVDTLLNPEISEHGEITGATVRVISTLTYDNQGRIVKEFQTWFGSQGFTRTFTYAYDARGNLVVEGWDPSWYDDKVSFLRTHPVFTFLTRNYSKNNPLKPSSPTRTYNSKKLPNSVDPLNDYFFTAYYGIAELRYDCK